MVSERGYAFDDEHEEGADLPGLRNSDDFHSLRQMPSQMSLGTDNQEWKDSMNKTLDEAPDNRGRRFTFTPSSQTR